MVVSTDDIYWPGKRFGLPEEGPRSVPGYSRRILALVIDWAISMAIAALLYGYEGAAILIIFVVLNALGGVMFAGSPGHLLTRIRIAPIKGGRLGVIAPLMRPLLIALVIPPLINDDDYRGVHDRLVGTILVTR
jgi:hypothetical protein